MMDVLGAMTDYGELIWHTESFMLTLRTHIPVLLKNNQYRLHSVNQKDAYVYAGNLYSYLSMIGIDKRYHYSILVANKFDSPHSFDVGVLTLILPEFEELERIKEIHMTH